VDGTGILPVRVLDGTGILPVKVLDGTGILPVGVIDGNLFVTSGLRGIDVMRGRFPELVKDGRFPEVAGIGVIGIGRVFDAAGGIAGELGVRGCSVDAGCATPRIDVGKGPVLRANCSIGEVVSEPSEI
jgi:hypothetical protein